MFSIESSFRISKAPKIAAPSRLQLELAERIGKEIRDGSLAVGAHLTEESFGTRYGVSRTLVRAALKLHLEIIHAMKQDDRELASAMMVFDKLKKQFYPWRKSQIAQKK